MSQKLRERPRASASCWIAILYSKQLLKMPLFVTFTANCYRDLRFSASMTANCYRDLRFSVSKFIRNHQNHEKSLRIIKSQGRIPLERLLGPTWMYLRPTWTYLGAQKPGSYPSGRPLGANLDALGVNFGVLGANLDAQKPGSHPS